MFINMCCDRLEK